MRGESRPHVGLGYANVNAKVALPDNVNSWFARHVFVVSERKRSEVRREFDNNFCASQRFNAHKTYPEFQFS